MDINSINNNQFVTQSQQLNSEKNTTGELGGKKIEIIRNPGIMAAGALNITKRTLKTNLGSHASSIMATLGSRLPKFDVTAQQLSPAQKIQMENARALFKRVTQEAKNGTDPETLKTLIQAQIAIDDQKIAALKQ